MSISKKRAIFPEKACGRCGQVFVPTGGGSRFCSAYCLRDGLAPVRSREDLTGRRFGCLIVDQPSIRRGPERRRAGSTYVGGGAFWLCICDCGSVKRASQNGLKNGMVRSCGCLRREQTRALGLITGPERWNWKGGLNSQGYRAVKVDGKSKLEHRVVMEDLLGRPLLPEETIHHINGVRHDNRPENLELWTSRHPKGQRVEDKVAWAIDLLKLYAPDRIR